MISRNCFCPSLPNLILDVIFGDVKNLLTRKMFDLTNHVVDQSYVVVNLFHYRRRRKSHRAHQNLHYDDDVRVYDVYVDDVYVYDVYVHYLNHYVDTASYQKCNDITTYIAATLDTIIQ